MFYRKHKPSDSSHFFFIMENTFNLLLVTYAKEAALVGTHNVQLTVRRNAGFGNQKKREIGKKGQCIEK